MIAVVIVLDILAKVFKILAIVGIIIGPKKITLWTTMINNDVVENYQLVYYLIFWHSDTDTSLN